MRQFISLLFLTLLTVSAAVAQTPDASAYHGAEATKTRYRAVYQLNTADTSVISHALANIQNALNDPRLKGKLDMELVVYGGANIVYRKDKPQFEKQLQNLQKQGVILAMCENTMRMRKIKREELFPFVSYVPTANGELIILQQDGWAIVHP